MASPERVSTSVSIRKEIAERLEREADERMVGRNLLVEKALEHYLDRLPPLAVDIDGPTTAEAAEKRATDRESTQERE